jgi:hypothetical protein
MGAVHIRCASPSRVLVSTVFHIAVFLLDMSAPAPCTCKCETTDSALSLTANAISIVTLAYVLLLGIGYRVAVYQRARDRVSSYHADAKALGEQIKSHHQCHDG